MKYSLSLGSIFGIKVQIHWTFLILLGWIVLSNMRAGAGMQQTIWAVLFILAIFACVTFHEFGHALAAKRFGIVTKDITLLPIGGLARLESIPEKPKEELIVALAGPLVNILIAPVLYPFSNYALNMENMDQLAAINGTNFVFNIMIINLWLAIFNLIPAFPMDGGRVLRALLSFKLERHKATRLAANIGQMVAIGFVILGFMANPFLIFIGFFIFLGAQSEAELTHAQSILKTYTVKDAVMHHFQTVRPDDTISAAVQMLLNGQCRSFLVVDESRPVGTLDRDEIIRAISARGEEVKIGEVMNKDLTFLQAEMPLTDAWPQIQRQKSLIPVMQGNELIGTLDSENVMEFIMVKDARRTPQKINGLKTSH